MSPDLSKFDYSYIEILVAWPSAHRFAVDDVGSSGYDPRQPSFAIALLGLVRGRLSVVVESADAGGCLPRTTRFLVRLEGRPDRPRLRRIRRRLHRRQGWFPTTWTVWLRRNRIDDEEIVDKPNTDRATIIQTDVFKQGKEVVCCIVNQYHAYEYIVK